MTYEEEDAANAAKPKKKRPEGNKKAKEKQADKIFVMNCLTNASIGTEEAVQKKAKYQDKKELFMESVGASMKLVATAFQQSMEESNDLKLLPYLSPNSKSQLVKEMFNKRMKRLTTPKNQVVAREDSVSS
jgi:hypothetical protein